MDVLSGILFVLGVGFAAANIRLLVQFIRFLRLRPSALLTWPGPKPAYYGFLLGIGAVLGLLVLYNLAVLMRHPAQLFGETMMLIYYGYGVPLSVQIRRGFYEDGIWAEGGFMRYGDIGGLTWREGPPLTLVLSYRERPLARRLVIPPHHYAEARRLLLDKMKTHELHFTGKPLDLGLHDEREDI
ncbi:hypothetical protein BH23ACI1_BH23ACI1_05370 [soil metagenome]